VTTTTIITRADALAQGRKRYFSGRPCLAGHVAERYCSTHSCVVCAHDAAAAWRRRQQRDNAAYRARRIAQQRARRARARARAERRAAAA
jgi:hypothetical protein